jgi:hypothetical protein
VSAVRKRIAKKGTAGKKPARRKAVRKAPKSVEIRSFQVGFGDCFLVSFVYGAKDKRHVLIDFGTTALPRKGKPSVAMPAVARAIRDVCRDGGEDGRLTAVVATHRHADHVSGFGTDAKTGRSGEVIKALRPKLVLQPWTEDPDAKPNAQTATAAASADDGEARNKGFVAALASMNSLADRVRRLAGQSGKWSASVRRELGFLGADNIANRSAIENLIAMGKAPGARALYLRYGNASGLEKLLPGVKVHVLGPPDLKQTKGIEKQRSRDRDQFWHFVSRMSPASLAGVGGGAGGGGKSKKGTVVPAEARWFRDRLDNMSGKALLEIVRQLDQQMNNTSLILLFEVFGKKLLFPGDAQIENWSYALTDAPDSAAVRELVADVDFYKVGHHGSLNATPRKLLWETFRRRKDRQLQTMVSTLRGKHGHTESRTEVPRRTLVAALKAGSRLKSTQELKAKETLHLIEIKPEGGTIGR